MLLFRTVSCFKTAFTCNKLHRFYNRCFSLNNCFFNKTNLNQIHPISSMAFTTLESPVKSPSDKKEYRVIRLENGLTACLISDTADPSAGFNNEPVLSDESDVSDTGESSDAGSEDEENMSSDNEYETPKRTKEQKMAAASLCVGVGSFSDPKEVPGMAHFLEHMVFMGSEKFPEENDFDSFIKKGGGSNNASTDTETTCFYFECLEEHLHTALDKFAQFFIAPLMKKGAMTREREAIESEFQMSLPSDSSKKEQLLFSLAKQDSPANSFSWGNLITLRDNVDDDLLYEGVHEFRKRHYSAHRMTLAIQARLPLDTLQNYVLSCFHHVPNNNLPSFDFSPFAGNVFDTLEFNKLYYVKPSKDLCQVDLTWSLPPLATSYKTNPLPYLSHLLGDEGRGSLSSYLRKKFWAIAISSGNASSGSEHNSMYTLFTMTIALTDDGLQHLQEVIESVFSYINLLKQIGPQQRIFNELKTISDTGFKFAREQEAVETVEELCEDMHSYPPQDYITSDNLIYEYDPEIIQRITNLLTPAKLNIMVMTSQNLPDSLKYDKKEKWFGTEYSDLDIPSDWSEKWTNVEPYPELNIPSPNPFLTNDFSILPEVKNNPEYPQKSLSSTLVELWFRQDQKFKLPIAYYYLYLITPLSTESAKNSAMLDMMMNILTLALAEELYPASCADLFSQYLTHDKGLVIKVYGYNEKLPLLLDVISKYLLKLNEHCGEEMFNTIKDKLKKNYYNKLLKPSSLAKDIRLELIVANYWSAAEKYLALEKLTFSEMEEFFAQFMETLYIKALAQGNISEDIAMKTVEKFVKDLNYGPFDKSKYTKFKVAQVHVGERCVRIKGFNKNDANSNITNYYQCGPFTIEDSVIIEVLMQIIEEPLFDILRTKEQLGYHIYCSLRETFGILGYTVTVVSQATKFTTQYVDSRIESFLLHSQKLLKEMSEDDLDQIKKDLIKTKECVDIHLKEEVDRNWSEIISDDYMFDRLQREIEGIKKISIKIIRNWWDSHNNFGKKEKFRKVSIQVMGHDTSKSTVEDVVQAQGDNASQSISMVLIGNEEMAKKENKSKDYFIQNIQLFKDNVKFYPPVDKVKN